MRLRLADTVHLEANLAQDVDVDHPTAVEDERRLCHVVIDALVVEGLELVPVKTHGTSDRASSTFFLFFSLYCVLGSLSLSLSYFLLIIFILISQLLLSPTPGRLVFTHTGLLDRSWSQPSLLPPPLLAILHKKKPLRDAGAWDDASLYKNAMFTRLLPERDFAAKLLRSGASRLTQASSKTVHILSDP